MPPEDEVGRWNHCVEGESYMWRKPGEAALPELAGADAYPNQVTIDRAVPFWGGISSGGCGPIVFHEWKKCTIDEWVGAVKDGTLGRLLRKLNPTVKDRPWRILCDGEGFLHSTKSMTAYARHDISLWKIPAHSPDLNPIEKFWSWLRRQLRRCDLQDFRNKRRPLTKPEYIARVKALLMTAKAKRAAANIAAGFRAVCKEVVDKRGAAARS